MLQRIELSDGENQARIDDACTELVLAVKDETAVADLVIPASVRSVQVVGASTLSVLELSGAGQACRLFSSGQRAIAELRLSRIVVEISDITVAALHLLGTRSDGAAVRFADGSKPVSFNKVTAQDAWKPELPHVFVRELETPELVVSSGTTVKLETWTGTETLVATLADDARLQLAGKTSVGPIEVRGPGATLELDSAIAERVTGVLGTLTTDGSCVLRGDNLRLSRLRCDTGADVAGVVAQCLDPASLSHIAKASAFDVALPRKRTWRDAEAHRQVSSPWHEPAAWRALYQQLEEKGRPATAAWARRMEKEARLVSAKTLSVERLILRATRLLGFGESVLRPLLVHAAVVILTWLLILLTKAYPAVYQVRDLVLLVPRLYLAPLRLLNTGVFAPQPAPSLFDTLAWTTAMMSGLLCFGTAALAVKRLLAYS